MSARPLSRISATHPPQCSTGRDVAVEFLLPLRNRGPGSSLPPHQSAGRSFRCNLAEMSRPPRANTFRSAVAHTAPTPRFRSYQTDKLSGVPARSHVPNRSQPRLSLHLAQLLPPRGRPAFRVFGQVAAPASLKTDHRWEVGSYNQAQPAHAE